MTKEYEDGEISPGDDNYDDIGMEIASPGSSNDASDDEAEQLRKILLEQIKTKRSSKHTKSKSNEPVTSKPSIKQTVKLVPPIRPPLSPPGFSSSYVLAPPPIPPNLDASTLDLSQLECSDSFYDSSITEPIDTPKSPDGFLDLSYLLDSPEYSGDELADELNLEDAKKDSRSRKREIDRLFRRQKANELEYQNVKSAIEKAKKELKDLEEKLLQHAEKGMELNERIKGHVERYSATDLQRLVKMSNERVKWKNKLHQRSEQSKERIKLLRENASLIMSTPYSRPKIIPLNPINSPSSTSQSDGILDSRQKVENSSKKPKSSMKAVDKLAEQLNIAQIIGDGKTNAQAEAELFTRMMERKKQRSTDDSLGNMAQPKVTTEEIVEDPTPPQPNINTMPFLFPSHLKRDANFPSSSRFGSLQEAAQNPLINIPSYRVAPSFPFEHIEHPALSNKINVSVPLCPFELHGICADPTCQFQHDRDLKLTDHDIIRQILNIWPTLCPPNTSPDQLATKLLEMNSVDYVAKMLASAIPTQIKDRCFSEDLKRLLKNSDTNK